MIIPGNPPSSSEIWRIRDRDLFHIINSDEGHAFFPFAETARNQMGIRKPPSRTDFCNWMVSMHAGRKKRAVNASGFAGLATDLRTSSTGRC